jgi:hypothetical protein
MPSSGDKLYTMEEVLPPQTAEGAGFESTRLRQFTVFLENRVGRLQSLVTKLEEDTGHVIAMCIEESADSALVRLISATPDAARDAIHAAGFSYTESDVLGVEFPKKRAHPLMAICSALLSAELNIHYAYPFFIRPRGPAVALYVDDPTLAAQVLIRKGFTLLGESDFAE